MNLANLITTYAPDIRHAIGYLDDETIVERLVERAVDCAKEDAVEGMYTLDEYELGCSDAKMDAESALKDSIHYDLENILCDEDTTAARKVKLAIAWLKDL